MLDLVVPGGRGGEKTAKKEKEKEKRRCVLTPSQNPPRLVCQKKVQLLQLKLML